MNRYGLSFAGLVICVFAFAWTAAAQQSRCADCHFGVVKASWESYRGSGGNSAPGLPSIDETGRFNHRGQGMFLAQLVGKKRRLV